jgi:hypothetical protein
MAVWGSSLWSTRTRVQEGLGAEEAWTSSDCSVLTLCVSDSVSLDRPPHGETF